MLIEYLSVSQCEDDTEEDQSKCLARQKHDGSSVMIMATGESVASMPLDKERASQSRIFSSNGIIRERRHSRHHSFPVERHPIAIILLTTFTFRERMPTKP